MTNNKLYKPILIDSIKAKVDTLKHRFIGFDGDICKTGTKAYGISEVETEAGQYAPIGVLGIFLVEAGGNITAGQELTSNEKGCAVALTGPGAVNGIALDSASEGDLLRVIRGI